MSYYYTYYLAYEKNGKLYPYGPFDSKGKLCSILSKSRSFTSNLPEFFKSIEHSKISDELYKSLLTDETIKECEDADKPYSEKENEAYAKIFGTLPEPKKIISPREALENTIEIEYLELSALPHGDFVKEGYVPMNELQNEERDEDEFYDVLSPHVYAEKIKNVSVFGDTQELDCEGEPLPKLSEYVYHKWIDFNSKEYESYLLEMMADNFCDYKLGTPILIKVEG